VWLRGVGSARWALVLSFAAFGQSLDSSLVPGDLVTADVHRYPGGASRVLVGERSGEVEVGTGAAGDLALDVAGVCEVVGRALATEPWLERAPFVVRATPTVADQRWVITDGTGSLPLAGATRTGEDALAVLVAASAGRAVTLAAEWTPDGVVPLTLFLADRALDIGPRADASFVSAA
jgi:hypothetical protein